MTETVSANDALDLATRRARAFGRRRRAAGASTALPDFVPPVALSDGPLGAIQAADREIARQTALRARAVVEFAASRPATADRAQGEPGAMSSERWAARPESLRSVSEWAPQELVVGLSITSEAAEALLVRSLTLVHRLPGTLAALEAGALHAGHLWPMLEKVAPIENATVRAEVEAGLLRWAAGRVTTPAQLGAKARREVLRRDARSAARQLEKAIRERGVHLRPGSTDGMAAVTSLLTLPEGRLLIQQLEACADAIPADPDDLRTRQQKMADCLMDLIMRPGESDAPSVQLVLTVVASISTLAGGDEPGEIDGQVVPAAMVRDLVHRFAGRPAEPGASTVGGPTASVGELAGREERDPSSEWCAAPGWGDDPEDPERWWAEMERQVRMDEAGLGSDRPPDSLPPSTWPPEAEPEDPERWWAEMERQVRMAEAGLGQDSSPTALSLEAADPDVKTTVTVDESGWWQEADRAIALAGTTLRKVEEAMRHARRLVRRASVADAHDEAEWEVGPGGRLTDAGDALAALAECTGEQRNWLAELLMTTGGGGLLERPRIALTDALSGTLLALTDLPELRRVGTCGARACRRDPARCTHDLSDRPGMGPPGPTDGYRPSAPLDRWVRARDRRCRAPGCRRPVPRGGELDHSRPHPLGPTSAGNLVGYCTGHHRGKHQAAGWRHDLAPDGTLTVTTPTGLSAVTTPPPY